MSKTKLMPGDNIESLKKLPDNSIDSIVTDPPYGLSFMNKKWDYDVPSVQFWKEVLRVLKPGGHVLSFGGTRTYHRMVVNIEDAGFEIRDQVMWLYGSGFPKSHNISKAIDKAQGNERKVIGRKIQRVDGTLRNVCSIGASFLVDGIEGSISKPTDGYIDIEEPGSESSKKYEGWGTALKPANEPICVARKPLSEKTIALNVIKWGTGGINIDGCRIGTEGRFPANIILDEGAAELLDRQSGVSTTKSSFFYVAKVSKTERNLGLDLFEEKQTRIDANYQNEKAAAKYQAIKAPSKNTHPTLKPINLMTYLCRLITPAGGIVLDPFMGSGSTGIAARLEGFRFVGMEMDGDYFKIAEARIEAYEEYRKLLK